MWRKHPAAYAKEQETKANNARIEANLDRFTTADYLKYISQNELKHLTVGMNNDKILTFKFEMKNPIQTADIISEMETLQ